MDRTWKLTDTRRPAASSLTIWQLEFGEALASSHHVAIITLDRRDQRVSIKFEAASIVYARAEAARAYAVVADEGIAEIGKHLAANLPPGWALWWTQYTPNFNDGEACTFSVRDAYLVPESKLDDCRRSSHAEGAGIGLYSAEKKYGTPDETKTYKQDDRSKPLNQAARQGYGFYESSGAYQSPKYEQIDVPYVEPGFPAIEGYSLEKLQALIAAWGALPEALLEATFGDHARCVVKSDGTATSSDHDHD